MSDGTTGMEVAGHPLPQLLRESTDPQVIRWREQLPLLVPALLTELGLTAGAPFSPGGGASWVAPVRDASGRRLVLKVAWAHEEARDEAAGMAAWQACGVAEVLEHRLLRGAAGAGAGADGEGADGEELATTVLLMEQVLPGTELAESAPWAERDEILAALLRDLWSAPVPQGVFRPLEHMCAWWADEAAGRHARDPQLSDDLARRGLELMRELPRTWDGEPRLLATDLHHHNILAQDGPDGTRRWVLIDPKPYVGDPHYDLTQHMLNDAERLTSQPRAFTARMAQLTGLDADRAELWLLARCVQEAGTMEPAARAAQVLWDAGVGRQG